MGILCNIYGVISKIAFSSLHKWKYLALIYYQIVHLGNLKKEGEAFMVTLAKV